MPEPPLQEVDLVNQPQEPGVAAVIAAYEAVERVYFQAVAATPPAVAAVSYAATTNRR